MNLAYVDTSCLVAVAFGEDGFEKVRDQLDRFDGLLSANLLEAELRATFAREGVAAILEGRLLAGITWLYPNRPLTDEYRRVLAQSTLKGADLRHLACALFLRPQTEGLAFLTLDKAHGAAARKLGFPGLE